MEEKEIIDYSSCDQLLVNLIQEQSDRIVKLESTLSKCKCNWKY
jgi:hypothetical protein